VIFVDTSFWIAYYNIRDPQHGEAIELLLRSAGTQLVTTNHVRGETWTFLRRRADYPLAMRFLDRLQRSAQVRTVIVSERQEGEAFKWLRQHDERPYSYVDATSFAVMRAMHIREVLGYDEDFVAAGFRRLN
jgi:predicted nucleic acid-binding protein